MSSKLEKKIGYTFCDPAILETALTHASNHNTAYDYERLEFLGDRVLNLAVADLVYRRFPQEKEGSLAKRHAALVQQVSLAKIAQGLDLADYLKLSPSEVKSGGKKKEKILADALEALIGGIYLDSRFVRAREIIEKFWGDMLREQGAPPEDAKSKLQEWAQARGFPLPVYKLLNKSGTDHSPEFEVEVFVESAGKATAVASSKRAAEKAAALKILKKMEKKIDREK